MGRAVKNDEAGFAPATIHRHAPVTQKLIKRWNIDAEQEICKGKQPVQATKRPNNVLPLSGQKQSLYGWAMHKPLLMKTLKWREKIPSAGVVIGEKMKEKRLSIADLNGVPERVSLFIQRIPGYAGQK